MDYRTAFLAKPGAPFRLADCDAGFHNAFSSRSEAQPEIDAQLKRMGNLQEKLYAERRHSLLIVLQGIDAAGKDGVCWHVLKGMGPQGCHVHAFKVPSDEEKAHDFLWRIHPHTPALGSVAVFNRSHYEAVLVERVHDLVPEQVWKHRYETINDFERGLELSGTTILKFFLFISKEEQLKRFGDRLDDPDRHWKISESDYTERARWDDYMAAYDDMIGRCSTEHAPWYVIPSNHKWFRDLAISQIIANTLQDMDLRPPEPNVDIAAIRKLYAAEVAKAKKDK
ncbi:PPK2 family polyphosphate:nucleotide phosphotransferase [Azorhizobium sp. AG788]|uniref:polyphosphate kinase 2 family protein n=1 Tax=Azorhizobium sp. AG788 TaxID=2183897 RepID=UPI00105F120B|nr:polyphosphate kinase 2 family protein [Azorhizobium sp. AG788]TDU00616.1 PPK2 family polyphosphate:nucleotide phosphotransferase [Azorhizobium sp. AG788]